MIPSVEQAELIFFDTAPLVYFVEENPTSLASIRPVIPSAAMISHLALVACVLLAACASSPPPLPDATAPVAWASVADEEVPEIVTLDPDGEVRETKLWIVVVDGSGFVRTSGTRWLRNLERDPNLVLRIGGAAHRLRAEPVSDPALAERIQRAFREKYGFSDRVVGWLPLGDATLLRLVEPPAS